MAPQTQGISSENLNRFIALPADKRKQVFDGLTPDAQQAVIAAIRSRKNVSTPPSIPDRLASFVTSALGTQPGLSAQGAERFRQPGLENKAVGALEWAAGGVPGGAWIAEPAAAAGEALKQKKYGKAAAFTALGATPAVLPVLGERLEESRAAINAAREMGAAVPERISGVPAWVQDAERRFDYASRRLGENLQQALRVIKNRARTHGNELFERATKAIDQRLPSGVASVQEIAADIDQVIKNEAGSEELRGQVEASLPKGIHELLSQTSPEELTPLGRSGPRSAGRGVEGEIRGLIARLQQGGMSQSDIEKYLLSDSGYPKAAVRSVVAAVRRGAEEGGADLIGAKRLNEIQREIGNVAYRNKNPAAERVLRAIDKMLGEKLQSAANNAGVGDLWRSANQDWSHFIYTFYDSPIANALETKVPAAATKALTGDGEQFARVQLERYAQRGDEAVGSLLKTISRASRVRSLRALSRYGHFLQVWPIVRAGTELARQKPSKALRYGTEDEAATLTMLALLRRVLGSLALRGL